MGFLINYKFYKEISKGEYDKSDVQSNSIKVGNHDEDVSLDVLAGKVMALMARRNVLVIDVEIFEFTKKQLTFKETEDGITIKNKKFKFDDGSSISVSGESVESVVLIEKKEIKQQNISVPSVLVTPAEPAPPAPVVPKAKQDVALRNEIFDPEIKELVVETKKRGMAFTLGKSYPIFSEKIAPVRDAGMMYTTMDDNGKKHSVTSRLFRIGGFDPNETRQDMRVSYSGGGGDNMPTLRR